jgi:hypothetical protein
MPFGLPTKLAVLLSLAAAFVLLVVIGAVVAAVHP